MEVPLDGVAVAGDLLGRLDVASYVIVRDVRADAWGYQGRTQEFRYIQGKAL